MSGKKHTDALKKFDRDQFYAPTEALALVASMASASFDETVDVAVRLGVDPRKADQMVRGTVALPSGTGKDVRIAVFAAGEAAQEARAAGADIVGADDLAAEIEAGMMDFDHRHRDARHDARRRSSRPRPRSARTDAEPEDRNGHQRRRPGRRPTSRAASVEYRTDRYGNVHVPIGKRASNWTRSSELPCGHRRAPACQAGIGRRVAIFKKITVSSTMGPGVRVDTGRLKPETA
jgi:large subunit ribosomal protein L1